MNKLIAGGCCALLFWTTSTIAASIYRCSDADGKLTFTQQGCPTDQAALVQEAANPTPGSGKAVPLAKPVKQRSRRDESSRSLTVVGTQDDGCGNLITGTAKREALIKQRVLPGMTRADVESTLGSPDSVTSRNGKVQYRYSSQKGKTRTVSFDQYGCVGGKG